MKKAISILAAASVSMMLTACSKMVYYTADDYMDVTVSGVNGKGSASVMFDKYNLLERINNDLYKGKADDLQLAKAEIGLYEYVDYDILDDNTENLSNGDTIAIKVTGNNEALSEFGFGVDEDNSVFVYTVEGLEEPTVMDLFKDVTVNVKGISPFLDVEAEYTGNDQFLKNKVRYYIDDPYIDRANGDTVTVIANVSDSVLEENNFMVETKEKEFEINGYDKYADTASDFSSVAKNIDDYAHSLFEKEGEIYSVNWEHDARGFFKHGDAFEYWTVRKQKITPVKAVLYTADYSTDTANSYNIFYRIDMEIEKTNEKYSPDTRYEIGDIEESSIYFCVEIYNIIEKPDGSIEFNENNRNIITYSTSLFGNYVGADLNEVSAARDKDMYNYKSEELDIIVS